MHAAVVTNTIPQEEKMAACPKIKVILFLLFQFWLNLGKNFEISRKCKENCTYWKSYRLILNCWHKRTEMSHFRFQASLNFQEDYWITSISWVSCLCILRISADKRMYGTLYLICVIRKYCFGTGNWYFSDPRWSYSSDA